MNAIDYLSARINRLNTTYKDTWPRWNNGDLVAVSGLRAELAQLRADNARLTQERDFNAGIIDGLNAAIRIKDDEAEQQAERIAALEQALNEAREVIRRAWILSDLETSKKEVEQDSNAWQIEADTRAWLSAHPGPDAPAQPSEHEDVTA